MGKEKWKFVNGYEGIYEVSDKGSVRRAGGKLLKQQISPKGYKRISLSKSGKTKSYFVHRLVAEAFRQIHFENRRRQWKRAEDSQQMT